MGGVTGGGIGTVGRAGGVVAGGTVGGTMGGITGGEIGAVGRKFTHAPVALVKFSCVSVVIISVAQLRMDAIKQG